MALRLSLQLLTLPTYACTFMRARGKRFHKKVEKNTTQEVREVISWSQSQELQSFAAKLIYRLTEKYSSFPPEEVPLEKTLRMFKRD